MEVIFILKYDRLIFGAGLYGLYFACICGERGESVLVIERDPAVFMRATYINQARVHMGYHYPRSYSTTIKSKNYFERFVKDFGFCIYKDFRQVYATSRNFSWTNKNEFIRFCHNAGIPCDSISPDWYFQNGMCDGAFLTKEYTYDAQLLKQYFLEKLAQFPNVRLIFSHYPERIDKSGDLWMVKAQDLEIQTPFILNATYASVNEIHKVANIPPFKIKYEKCEIILCKVSERLKNVGITIMDGPFFSIMPFGKTGLHSLTSVTFTPHETSYEECASFPCQEHNDCQCSKGSLYNCNNCCYKPESAWHYMSQLARKYLKPEFAFSYQSSLFSMKPILLASELDDSRPTVIRYFSKNPDFVSVLSGKINTVYDLEEIFNNE